MTRRQIEGMRNAAELLEKVCASEEAERALVAQQIAGLLPPTNEESTS